MIEAKAGPWLIEKVGGIGGYVVRARSCYDGAVCDFEVFERPAERGDVALYTRKGACASGDYVETLDEAEHVFHGSIKWDGCSNVSTDSACMLHLCGPESWVEFGKVIALLPALALRAMGAESFG
jgi:hypothetical protein